MVDRASSPIGKGDDDNAAAAPTTTTNDDDDDENAATAATTTIEVIIPRRADAARPITASVAANTLLPPLTSRRRLGTL